VLFLAQVGEGESAGGDENRTRQVPESPDGGETDQAGSK
jgi:hypothetical protein